MHARGRRIQSGTWSLEPATATLDLQLGTRAKLGAAREPDEENPEKRSAGSQFYIVTGKEAIILPCLGRTESDSQYSGEQFVTVENSMGIVHKSQGYLKPASSHLRSEPWIVASLANATLNDSPIKWMDLVDSYNFVYRNGCNFEKDRISN